MAISNDRRENFQLQRFSSSFFFKARKDFRDKRIFYPLKSEIILSLFIIIMNELNITLYIRYVPKSTLVRKIEYRLKLVKLLT